MVIKKVLRPTPRITLSRPLLVGRKTKIMVETLLYEMIYGFIHRSLGVNSLRHGKDFASLMTSINQVTNLNVSMLDGGGLDHISHLQTIWQCDKCESEIVRFERKTNQPRDKAAVVHRKKCGGTWIAVV